MEFRAVKATSLKSSQAAGPGPYVFFANVDNLDLDALTALERLALVVGRALHGAVYLFARVPTNLKSMVRERTSFREKIVRTVYPIEEDAP